MFICVFMIKGISSKGCILWMRFGELFGKGTGSTVQKTAEKFSALGLILGISALA